MLRQVSSDKDRLEPTYADWLKVAEAHYNELIRQGARVEKVPVDVADMAVWCKELGRRTVDSEGRAAYVTYRLKELKGLTPPKDS